MLTMNTRAQKYTTAINLSLSHTFNQIVARIQITTRVLWSSFLPFKYVIRIYIIASLLLNYFSVVLRIGLTFRYIDKNRKWGNMRFSATMNSILLQIYIRINTRTKYFRQTQKISSANYSIIDENIYNEWNKHIFFLENRASWST